MNPRWMKIITQATKEHSPAILSGLAISGLVGTVVLAVRATPQAMAEIEKAEDLSKPMSFAEKAAKVWRFYAPAGITGAATIACIIGANRISSGRLAATAGAYALADTAFREYKDKVRDIVGDRKEQEVRDKIAEDRIQKNPANPSTVVIAGGETLCYDLLTGRYFRSDIERIRRAENEVNRRCVRDIEGIAQNEFYELLDLPHVLVGEELGWNVEHQMELVFSSVLSENGDPCLAIGYKNLPKKGYEKLY